MGADRGVLGLAAGDLCPQRRPDGDGDLLGPHARHQHRDRDAAQGLRPSSEAFLRVLRQPEDRPSGGAPHQGSGGDRRGRPSRARGPLHRIDDAGRGLRPDVHGQCAAGRDHGSRGAAHRLADDPLRRAHDAQLAGALWPGRRLQRPHRGECRRHPRRPGLRQRGSRAAPVRRRQPELSQDEAGGLPHHGGLHLAQLSQHAADPDGRDGCGQLSGAQGRAQRRRLRRLPAPRRGVLPPDREDQLGDRDLSEGHCRLPALPHLPRYPARYRRPPGREGRPQAQGRYRVPKCPFRLYAGTRCAQRPRPEDPGRRDRGLRRSRRARERPRSARCCPGSTRSTAAPSRSTASISGT